MSLSRLLVAEMTADKNGSQTGTLSATQRQMQAKNIGKRTSATQRPKNTSGQWTNHNTTINESRRTSNNNINNYSPTVNDIDNGPQQLQKTTQTTTTTTTTTTSQL